MEAYQADLAANLARQSVVGARSVSTGFEILPPKDSQTKGIFSLNQYLGVKPLPIQPLSVVNFSQGALQRTDRPTDFAIQGQAFFAVQEPGTDGGTATRYTRDGQFSFDSTGTLIATDGAKVLLDNGNPLTISPTAKDKTLSVLSDGTVYVGENKTPEGKLMTAHFEEPAQALVQTSTGRFDLAHPEAKQKMDGLGERDQIQQGAVESANISPVMEMSKLIDVMRAFEANQKAVMAQDDANGKMIDSMTQGISG